MPKRDLLAGLAVLLEQGQLKIPRGLKETGSLVRALTEIGVCGSGRGRGGDGGGGGGRHDDLAMALALASSRGRKTEAPFGFGMRRLI